MKKDFSLNWEMYPSYQQIKSDSKFSTLLITFGYEIADKAIDSFINSIKEKNYQIRDVTIDDEPKQILISESSSVYALMSPMFSFLISRNHHKLQSDFVQHVKEKFKNQVKEMVSVPHVEQKKELGSDLQVVYCSGTYTTKDDLTPYTFFILFYKDRIIGKALLEYFDYEVGDLAPTILMIEIAETQQGSGLGKKFLNFIECEMKKLGFSKIWSSDTQNEGFWTKMGYEIDIDEGFKRLIQSDCAEFE